MDPKERKDAAIKRQQEILAGAKTAGRDLSAEETREFDALQGTVEACDLAIAEGQKALDNMEEGKRAAEQERQRISEINAICRNFEVDASEYISSGKNMDEVRAAILDGMVKNSGPVNQGKRDTEITVVGSEEDKFRAAMTDALLIRGGVAVEKPAEGARDLRGMSLRDLAIHCVKADVKDAERMDSSELFEKLQRDYYNPSSEFSSIMDQTINKAYAEGYKQVATTFEAFTHEGSLSDFKTSRHEYLAGPAGEFERVEENGEVKSDKPSDALLPTRKLETYGKQFTMTRQAFINDDIGFLTTIPARYAQAGKKTINTQVYEIMVNNAAIYDGIPLFHANHKNLVSKQSNIGAPSSAAIQAMIIGLASQKDQHGQPIMIRPGAIVVPVGYGFAVQTVLESQFVNTADNTQAANPLYQYRTQIKVVEDPTINAIAAAKGLATVPWFMAADKADCGGIQVDYLNGNKIPTIRRMEKPGTLGFVWDVYHDWGITVTDYRGLNMNPGAALENEM